MFTNQDLIPVLPQIIQSQACFEDLQLSLNTIELYLKKPDGKYLVIDQLMAAWHYLMHHGISALTLQKLQTINQIVAKHDSLAPGEIRTGDSTVAIGQVTYQAPKINLKKLDQQIKQTAQNQHDLTKLICQLIIDQIFWDGNKRTMFLTLNWWQTMHSDTLCVIALNDYPTWQAQLSIAYQSQQVSKLSQWLLDYAQLKI